MKVKQFFRRTLLVCVPLLLGIGVNAQGLVLVSGTNFEVSGGEEDYWHSLDMVDQYEGIVDGFLKVGEGFKEPIGTAFGWGDVNKDDPDTENPMTFSEFLLDGTTPHFAVTPNPVRLDSARMYDNGNSKENGYDASWGVVFSAGNKGWNSNMLALTYTVRGLKDNSNYEVVVEWCNPHATTYLNSSGSNKAPHLGGGYQASIKVGVNNSTADGEYFGSPGTTAGSCNEKSVTQPTSSTSTKGVVGGGELNVNIFVNQLGAGEAIMIKSIKVYAEVEPKVSGTKQVCLGGQNSQLGVVGEWNNVDIQWYRDGSKIDGATGTRYTHTSANAGEKKYVYHYTLTTTQGGKTVTVKSKEFVVSDIQCCVDSEGNPMDRKMIWQDDFGTFTEKGSYWTWDYTNINEPKKVEHTTTLSNGWAYCLDYVIPGATCAASPSADGSYSVAGNITCVWNDLSNGDGTQWEWTAQSFNGKKPSENGYVFVPDHTYEGSAFGGMLYLNCGNDANATIYEREIKGLCETDLTVRCYVNTFSESANPVKIKIRVTDLNDGSNQKVSDVAMKYASTSENTDWIEVSVPISLKPATQGGTAGVKFEIVSEGGGAQYNQSGNDLVLDDIQVLACSSPNVTLYFDLNTFSKEVETCKGDEVELHVDVTKMIENHYGDDASYIYQYSTNPDDNSSWVSIGDITDESSFKDLESIFALDKVKDAEQVYFRVVLGKKEVLELYGGKFSANDACAAYAVSEPILAIVECPACTEPQDPEISAKATDGIVTLKGKSFGDEVAKYTTIRLCEGGTATLSTNDITGKDLDGNDYENYTMTWYEGKVGGTKLGSVDGTKATDLVVKYADVSSSGTKIIINVHDKFEDTVTPTTNECDKNDTVIVIANPKPVVPEIVIPAFCEGLASKSDEVTAAIAAIKEDLKGYSYVISKGTDEYENFDGLLTALDALKYSETAVEYSITITDDLTGCESEPATFGVTINEIPGEPTVSDLQFVVKPSGEESVGDAASIDADYTLQWAETTETATEPGTTVSWSETIPTVSLAEENTFYFFVRNVSKEGGCEGPAAKFKVEILSSPVPNHRDTTVCVGSEVVLEDNGSNGGLVSVDDSDGGSYELQWYATETGGESSAKAPTVSTSNPSQQIVYVSQKSKEAPFAESARVPVTITTIGVKEPTVTTPVEYCKNEKAEALTATKFEISDSYYYADGFMWKGPEDADYSATAPTPGTAAAGEAVYSVYQTYEVKGKLGTVIQTCEGEPVNITVKVYETEAPKEATVQYIKADASGNTFPAITQATTGAWKPEDGFEYYYSAISEDKAKPDESTYTTTVPVPTYDVSSLGGGTKELYCWVYRISEANGKACASEAVMITIKISDALPPSADNAYVCEGDAFPVLSAKANILEGSGKSADDYEIRWYENDPSAQSNPTPDGTGNTYDPKVSKALADGSKKKEYYRYVTQYDKTTDAESSPTKVTITVWPKPVWKLTGDEDPEATCEEPVDLSKAGSVTNTEDCSTPISYKYQFGEEVVEATTSITGLYNVIPSYDLPNAENIIYASEKTCEGEPVEVNVRVDSLTVLDIFGTTSVCPSEEGVGLTAKIDSSKTKPLTGLTYKWTGSQEGSGAAIVLDKFPGRKENEAENLFNYTVTVSTGVCEKSSKEHTIKVGEGVKEGTLTATEENNSDINSDETEDGGKAVFENGENCEIYTCGGEVTLTADFKKDENSQYEWYEIKDNKASLVESGATFKIPASDVASAKVYTLKYVNKCDVSIDIIVHNIPITVNFTEKDETLCEDASFTKEIEVTCDETPAIQWYRDGKEISGANQQVYTKSGIKEDIDEGVYSFKVSNRGCVVKDTVGELDVQRYIKVEPKTDPYIVIRGDQADMTVKITVPEDQDVAYVGWAEDSRDTVNKVKDYTIAAVDKNHDYTIELKDPDYCPATTTIQLLVDAKLQLTATLSDTLCLGTGDDLVLDTTGTGAFYDKTIQHSLTVERMMGGSKQDITGDFQSKDGKLVHNAQPTENATYRVLYTYGTQKIDTTLRVVVIPSISLDVPEVQTVCEGEEVELAVSNVQPDGTTVSWQTDPTIKSPMDDTLKITAQPTYNAATGANHQGEYTYVAIAYNEFCGKSEKFEVKVKVDEPLTGEITGTERMCEGESGRIDASQYAASQYVWTANGEEIGTSPSMSVKPAETTAYSLEMTRGKCSASDEFTLEVTSIPVILSVDSIDVRTREIITDEGKGTRPFTYWIDKESAKTKEPIIYDLAFSKHVAYVKDDNGCQTQFEFLMDPPAIFIPEYFTPNGDGINDTWEIGNVTEVYPNAHIQIFDRFGKLLVDMTGEENSWDGTYNGHKLPSTDYWYVIDIEEIDMQYNGHFTLIRQ